MGGIIGLVSAFKNSLNRQFSFSQFVSFHFLKPDQIT